MQRCYVRRLVGPDSPRTEADLQREQRQPEKTKFGQRIASAEFFQRQHGRRRHAQENRIGHEPVNHLQVHLIRRDGIANRARWPVRIVVRNRFRCGGRPDFPICERKIRDGQPGVLMPHRRGDEQLHKNQNRDKEDVAAESARNGHRFFIRRIHPPAAGEQREGRCEHQKALRDGTVRDAEPVQLPADAEAAENSLHNHQQKPGDAEPVNPFARIFQPEPDGENGRQQADPGGEQAVRVLKKCQTGPVFEWQRKHVVAIACRPVINGHAGFMAGHEAAEADEQECGDSVDDGEPKQRRLVFVVHVKKERPLRIFFAQRSLVGEKLFHFKREVLRCAVGFDFDFSGLRAELAMDGFERVFAGGNILDGEFAVRRAHGKIRMIKHADPGEHPGMHVALEFQKHFRLVEGVIQIRAALHLHLVGFRIGGGLGVDVVNERVGIFNDEFLAGLDGNDLRDVKCAFLVQHRRGCARAGGLAGNAFQRNHYVCQLAAGADHIKFCLGQRAGIQRGAIGIFLDGREFLGGGRRALEIDDAGDVAGQHNLGGEKSERKQQKRFFHRL